MNRRARDRAIYWLVWTGCLLPIPLLIWWFYDDDLGANPAKRGLHFLGEWGLRLLVIGLAITPLRKLFGWGWLQRFRRTIGLFAAAYIALHLLVYIGLDQNFDWAEIWRDIVKRPYITFGMLAFVLMLPLAITSTNAMIRRLGARRWRSLHRLAYVIAPLGVLHYDLLVKKDASWPHFYAAAVAALLAYRLEEAIRARLRRRNGAAGRTVAAAQPRSIDRPQRTSGTTSSF
jgi:sulfoxide reductase heme-binding subunit YedZ